MKTKINRNILWTETFAKELISIGVKYACISPGSRNTPLTLAFAENKKLKSYIHIDERSCGFFALGLAKASNTPVVVITTSGTATSELYPAIIEAYQQRVPLIICTADRPPELLDCGANQTINQNNLYKNHIRWFIDVGLPEPIIRRIKHIKIVARRAYYESFVRSKGPVHLNFPFRKPFEPDSYTDEVSEELTELAALVPAYKKDYFSQIDSGSAGKEEEKNISSEKWFKEIFNHVRKKEKGLIIAGPENYDPQFLEKCQTLAQMLNYPILADGTSQLRFGNHVKENIISNFEGFLRSDSFANNHQPDIIIHFGRTITSKALDQYLESCNTIRFMINEFGDWFDPSNKAIAAFACKPYLFCQKMIDTINGKSVFRNGNGLSRLSRAKTGWIDSFKNADDVSFKVKNELIDISQFPNECRIINEVIRAIPNDSQIMISNSMPIRDFDYFASMCGKNITIYNNRGASGIDGITSTALGIIEASKKTTILIAGDLAFYYDLNGLLAAKKYSIPLIIVLINNNGGGIFEVLPISKYGKVFKEYFIAPHDLDFSKFVDAYDGNYHLIRSWDHFQECISESFKKSNFSVLEIKTDAVKSLKLRNKYWHEVGKRLA